MPSSEWITWRPSASTASSTTTSGISIGRSDRSADGRVHHKYGTYDASVEPEARTDVLSDDAVRALGYIEECPPVVRFSLRTLTTTTDPADRSGRDLSLACDGGAGHHSGVLLEDFVLDHEHVKPHPIEVLYCLRGSVDYRFTVVIE